MSTFSSNERAYDNLLVAGKDYTTKTGVLLSGQSVVRGQALGRITASGKLRTWGGAGSDDGHRTFFAIAADTVDATSADTSIDYYYTGQFLYNGITISGDQTADDITDILDTARDIGIIIVPDISAQA